jgi:hypothetical protein
MLISCRTLIVIASKRSHTAEAQACIVVLNHLLRVLVATEKLSDAHAIAVLEGAKDEVRAKRHVQGNIDEMLAQFMKSRD